ncbi:MAG TPA: hypothetical protein DD473_22785 [Planctomycetaceae bacterium]|nr:hypothetical protein [Planctomycetaceae bacterium]
MNRQQIISEFKLLALVGALVLIGLNSSSAATPAVQEEVSKKSVQVAEPFTIAWTVTAAANAKVTFPESGKQLGDFDIMDTNDLFDIPVENSAARTWTRRMTLESIQTGELTIPSLEIQVSDASGSQRVRSDPVTIHVASVLEDRSDPTQFRDIQSVVNVEVPVLPTYEWVRWTAGGFSGLVLLSMTVLFVTRRKSKLSPEKWALLQLDNLESEIEAGSTDSEKVTDKISEIVHDFLQLQLEIPETGCTSDELLRQVQKDERFSSDSTEQLTTLFSSLDQSKYAGLKMDSETLLTTLQETRLLVQRVTEEFSAVSTGVD